MYLQYWPRYMKNKIGIKNVNIFKISKENVKNSLVKKLFCLDYAQ